MLSSTLFFRPEYGLDVLLEAVARLRAVHPRLGCVVMGGGDPAEAEALVRRRGLGDSVRLLGDLDHEECLQVMARSDLFVRPSRADGDSISVREAVALGVRTVASDVGRRPSGVHLCAAGDVDALVHAIERARAAPAPEPELAAADAHDALQDLYASHERSPRDGAGVFDARTVLRG
jgi:glycosyltransferase involved in cell wall biosynthesis